jgi:hypothetical protein
LPTACRIAHVVNGSCTNIHPAVCRMSSRHRSVGNQFKAAYPSALLLPTWRVHLSEMSASGTRVGGVHSLLRDQFPAAGHLIRLRSTIIYHYLRLHCVHASLLYCTGAPRVNPSYVKTMVKAKTNLAHVFLLVSLFLSSDTYRRIGWRLQNHACAGKVE